MKASREPQASRRRDISKVENQELPSDVLRPKFSVLRLGRDFRLLHLNKGGVALIHPPEGSAKKSARDLQIFPDRQLHLKTP